MNADHRGYLLLAAGLVLAGVLGAALTIVLAWLGALRLLLRQLVVWLRC